jgi:hypothetical protein
LFLTTNQAEKEWRTFAALRGKTSPVAEWMVPPDQRPVEILCATRTTSAFYPAAAAHLRGFTLFFPHRFE